MDNIYSGAKSAKAETMQLLAFIAAAFATAACS